VLTLPSCLYVLPHNSWQFMEVIQIPQWEKPSLKKLLKTRVQLRERDIPLMEPI